MFQEFERRVKLFLTDYYISPLKVPIFEEALLKCSGCKQIPEKCAWGLWPLPDNDNLFYLKFDSFLPHEKECFTQWLADQNLPYMSTKNNTADYFLIPVEKAMQIILPIFINFIKNASPTDLKPYAQQSAIQEIFSICLEIENSFKKWSHFNSDATLKTLMEDFQKKMSYYAFTNIYRNDIEEQAKKIINYCNINTVKLESPFSLTQFQEQLNRLNEVHLHKKTQSSFWEKSAAQHEEEEFMEFVKQVNSNHYHSLNSFSQFLTQEEGTPKNRRKEGTSPSSSCLLTNEDFKKVPVPEEIDLGDEELGSSFCRLL